jgi:rSAM/selenodomain-associated transferase 1
VIFAKAPVPGQVKTRMVPALGAEAAAALAARLLRHAVRQALAAAIGPVELCAAPARSHPLWKGLGLPEALEWSEQGMGDLGERLARASRRVLERGERVLLIGGDCPELDASRLQAAAAALGSHEAVLIPAADGGYVLLGLTRFAAAAFEAIPWSSERVAALTLQRLEGLAWRTAVLPGLADVDVPADLQRLPPELLPPG